MARNFSSDIITLGDVSNAKFDKDVVWTVGIFALGETLGDADVWPHPIAKWGNGGDDEQFALTIRGTDQRVLVDMAGAARITSAFTALVNTWYLYIVTCDGASGLTLYVLGLDGTFHVNGATGTAVDATDQTHSVNIGRRFAAGSEPWDGDIAEVAYFDGTEFSTNDALAYLQNPARVALQYGTEFYLPIDGESSPEPDYSGNGIHGTVFGTVYANHPPVIPGFGLDVGWVEPAAAAAGGFFSRRYYDQYLGVG